ncbi:MAG TPA: methyltransferase domain-containing protein [Solirubrobacteraceae bacterium]|nr:methyltransferase domain-containing protein [Solirubrobacteraceae bacterium]
MSERDAQLRALQELEQHVPPALAERIVAALGDDRTVLSAGATLDGALAGRAVIALVPPGGAAAPDAEVAETLAAEPWELPLGDDSVDAAIAVRAVHYWGEQREPGVRELRRVARNHVVILTIDPAVNSELWLFRDYLPQIAERNRTIFPPVAQLVDWLGGAVETVVVPARKDAVDWSLSSSWAHPEAIRDAQQTIRASGMSSLDPAVIDRALSSLERDLADGRWDRRNGHLRALYEYDIGMRLLVSTPH